MHLNDFCVTPQHLRFFETFGFLKFPGLFDVEVKDIEAAFEDVWVNSGKEHDHEERSLINQFAERNEYLSGLLDDSRVHGIVSAILGDDYNFSGSDGNYYVGDTPWHSDQLQKAPNQSVKIAFYLDTVTRDTGCLRVIPGSNHPGDNFAGLLDDVVPLSRQNRNEEVWGVHGSEIPAYAVESEPGDMLIFNHWTKHSSWGGSSARRMFTYNFEQHFPDELLPELRDKMGGYIQEGRKEIYESAVIRTASSERMKHLEQRLEVWAEMCN